MRHLYVALRLHLKHHVHTGKPRLQVFSFLLHRSPSHRGLAHEAQSSVNEQDATKLASEKTLANINKALLELGSEETASPPPHYVLHRFFEQKKSIAQVVDLLREGLWDEEVQMGLKSFGIKYDPPLVIQVLRADISFVIASRFFHWLKGVRKYQHNEFTYGAMLNLLGRAGRLQEMQQLFDEMQANACLVTPVTLSNVMLWYFRAKDVQGVAGHWQLLRQSGAKLSPAVYAAYIDYLLKAKRYTKVAVIFEEMLRIDCLPTSRTYTVFIQHLVENGKVETATKILEIMQTVHLVPSRMTYKTLINAFAKNGDVERVLELWDEMREHFHRPTKHFLPAVKAVQAAGKLDKTTILLEEISTESSSSIEIMESSDDEGADDCHLSDWRAISCLHVGFDVNAFAQALHKWDSKVEETLEQANVQWERYLVMGVLKRLRNVDSLWPFFHWLKDKAGYKHDSFSSALLIERIFKSRSSLAKKASLVMELIEGLRSSGMKLTVPMFNRVMRYYVGAGEGDRAFALFKLMKECELDPNTISYALVIEGCAKNNQVERVKELLKEMEEKGFHLSSSACAQYVTCLASVGNLEEAYTFFCGTRASPRHPSPVEYMAIIAAYDRVRDNTMALQLYDEMKEAGIRPTQDMYKVVTKVLQEANRVSEVNALAEERKSLDFFGGKRIELQDKLLSILFLFMESFKPKKSQKSGSIIAS